MSPQPKLVIDGDGDTVAAIPAIPSQIPSFTTTTTNIPSFLTDSKRSILKSSLRAYEADPVKLTPGLDPSNLSTSPIAEPVMNASIGQARVRFASTDQIFQVRRGC